LKLTPHLKLATERDISCDIRLSNADKDSGAKILDLQHLAKAQQGLGGIPSLSEDDALLVV
jgi:hypothetical protein